MRVLKLLLLLSFPLVALASPTELTVPVYGDGVRGSDATWQSRILISNPQDFTVVVSVARILPVTSEPCVCPGVASVTIPARDTRVLESVFVSGQRLTLGAVVLSASAAVHVDSWIDRIPYDGGKVTTQAVETLTDWVPPGAFAWIPRVFGGLVPESTNLFLINPNPFPITVQYDNLPGAEPVQVVMTPNSMAVRRVAFLPFLTGAPREGVRMTFSSTDPFFALTSDGVYLRHAISSR